MTFAAAPAVSDLTLGKFLKIVSKGVVYNNLSEDTSMWDLVKKMKKGPAEGRELRFLLRSGYGAGAVGFMPPTGGDYPTAHKSTVQEGLARYKDYALTVEVERTLIAKAISDFSKYGEPLADELRVKGIALSRMLSAAAYSDGTGVLATIGTTPTISSGSTTIILSSSDSARGFVGHIQLDDKVLIKAADGTARTPTGGSGTFSHYLVTAKDREANTVTLVSYNTLGAVMANSGVGSAVAGEYIYKANQTTFNDLASISTNDYNTISESIVGLESLSAKDGRVVNGITMSGGVAGTRVDCGGAGIDSKWLQKLMSQVMINVGQGRYKYDRAMMAWETLDALVEAREVDRKFTDVKDNKRGVEGLGYIHGNNKLIFEQDEFCRKNRVIVAPNGDVLQFHGSDFDFVQAQPGQKFHVTPSANGGFQRSVSAMMEGNGALLSVHSPAIGMLHNFTIA